MAVSVQLVARCESILEEVARRGERITYGELMAQLGIGRHQIAQCLNPIYQKCMREGRADLTNIVHYSGKPFGLYNSRGGPAQSVVVDGNNAAQVAAYKADLRRVYTERNIRPSARWRRWLES